MDRMVRSTTVCYDQNPSASTYQSIAFIHLAIQGQTHRRDSRVESDCGEGVLTVDYLIPSG